MSGEAYRILAHQLGRSSIALDVSEIHGLFCGMLAVDIGLPAEQCLLEILPDRGQEDADDLTARQLLEALLRQTRSDLTQEGFGFQLLLPKADVPFDVCLQSLARWCEGFSGGLGLAGRGAAKAEALPEAVREFVIDVTEIARVEAAGVDAETAETALLELIEYIRIGVLLVYEELRFPIRLAKGV